MAGDTCGYLTTAVATVCHSAMAEDCLDVTKMNVGPGGKQRIMQDGFWDGCPQDDRRRRGPGAFYHL